MCFFSFLSAAKVKMTMTRVRTRHVRTTMGNMAAINVRFDTSRDWLPRDDKTTKGLAS